MIYGLVYKFIWRCRLRTAHPTTRLINGYISKAINSNFIARYCCSDCKIWSVLYITLFAFTHIIFSLYILNHYTLLDDYSRPHVYLFSSPSFYTVLRRDKYPLSPFTCIHIYYTVRFTWLISPYALKIIFWSTYFLIDFTPFILPVHSTQSYTDKIYLAIFTFLSLNYTVRYAWLVLFSGVQIIFWFTCIDEIFIPWSNLIDLKELEKIFMYYCNVLNDIQTSAVSRFLSLIIRLRYNLQLRSTQCFILIVFASYTVIIVLKFLLFVVCFCYILWFRTLTNLVSIVFGLITDIVRLAFMFIRIMIIRLPCKLLFRNLQCDTLLHFELNVEDSDSASLISRHL